MMILELNEGNTFLIQNTSVVQPRFEERIVYRGCTVDDNPVLCKVEASNVNASLSQRALCRFPSCCRIRCSERKQLWGGRGVLSSLFWITSPSGGEVTEAGAQTADHVIVTVRSRKALMHQCCLLTWHLATVPYSFVVQATLPWECLDAHWTFSVKTSVDVSTDQLDLDNSSVDGDF